MIRPGSDSAPWLRARATALAVGLAVWLLSGRTLAGEVSFLNKDWSFALADFRSPGEPLRWELSTGASGTLKADPTGWGSLEVIMAGGKDGPGETPKRQPVSIARDLRESASVLVEQGAQGISFGVKGGSGILSLEVELSDQDGMRFRTWVLAGNRWSPVRLRFEEFVPVTAGTVLVLEKLAKIRITARISGEGFSVTSIYAEPGYARRLTTDSLHEQAEPELVVYPSNILIGSTGPGGESARMVARLNVGASNLSLVHDVRDVELRAYSEDLSTGKIDDIGVSRIPSIPKATTEYVELPVDSSLSDQSGKRIWVVVDPEGTVDEIEEGNNQSFRTLEGTLRRRTTVQDGKFMRGDGKPLWPVGVAYPGDIDDTRDENIRLIRMYGFNFVRVPVEWRRLEPMPGYYDSGYADKLLRTRRLLERYGLAYAVDFHLTQEATKPVFIDSWDDVYAKPWVRERFKAAWRYVTYLLSGPECVGYEVPGNEVGLRPNGVLNIDAKPEEFQSWLSESYGGDLKKLGRNWSLSPLGVGEMWGNIDTTKVTTGGVQPRQVEAKKFYSQRLFDFSSEVMGEIRSIDPDAVGLLQDAGGYGPANLEYWAYWRYPEGVMGSTAHLYPNSWNDGMLNLSDEAVSTRAYPVAHYSSFLLSGYPVFNGETGNHPRESATRWEQEIYYTQLFRMGIGMTWWVWARNDGDGVYVPAYRDGTLKYEFETLPVVAKAFQLGQPKGFFPKVGVVMDYLYPSDHFTFMGGLGLGDFLDDLHVDYAFVSDFLIAERPEVLNKFAAVISVQGRLSDPTRRVLRDYSLAGGRLLLLGRAAQNEYMLPLADTSVYAGWMFDPSAQRKSTSHSTGSIDKVDRLTVRANFGDLRPGTVFDNPKNSALSLDSVLSADLARGAEILIERDGSGGQKFVGAWKSGNTVWFYDVPNQVVLRNLQAERAPVEANAPRGWAWEFANLASFKRVIKAFLKDCGVPVDADTPGAVMYSLTSSGYVLLANTPNRVSGPAGVDGPVRLYLSLKGTELEGAARLVAYDLTGKVITNANQPDRMEYVPEGLVPLRVDPAGNGRVSILLNLKKHDFRLFRLVQAEPALLYVDAYPISSEWDRADNRFRVILEKPAGFRARMAVHSENRPSSVSVDGIPVSDWSFDRAKRVVEADTPPTVEDGGLSDPLKERGESPSRGRLTQTVEMLW